MNKHLLLYVTLGSVVLGLVVGITLSSARSANHPLAVTQVSRTTLSQEVRSAGTVKPAQDADLAFETAGRINTLSVKAGDRVKAGQMLASLEAADLSAQLLSARSAVLSAQAMVLQAETARDMTTQKDTSSVQTSEVALQNALNNLEVTQTTATTKLNTSNASALSTLQTASTVAKNLLLTLTDLQYLYFRGDDQNKSTIELTKSAANSALFGVDNTGAWSRVSMSELSGGLYGRIQTSALSNETKDVEQLLPEFLQALNLVSSALNSILVKETMTSTDVATLTTAKTSINAQISAVSSAMQSIETTTSANDSALVAAQSAVDLARSTLATAKSLQSVTRLAPTNGQTARSDAGLLAANAQLAQAQAAVLASQAQLSKTVLRAPFDGVVADVYAQKSEHASPAVPVLSVIASSGLEVELYLPEAEFRNVVVGNPATVQLDAFGTQTFQATVATIAQTQTDVNGTALYKTTLVFTQPDVSILSGMKADVRIQTAQAQNTLTVPESSLFVQKDKTFIYVPDTNGQKEQREVEVGLKQSGMAQILSGLSEGESVVTFSTVR